MAENGKKKKTAIVLIHGIGEQRPMKTLNEFVDVLWSKDKRAGGRGGKRLWVKPDHISGDFELRRLTTGYAPNNKRFDFFEFYWAHLMTGNELADIIEWLRALAWRNPARVPQRLRLAFFALWIAILVFATLVIITVISERSLEGWLSVTVAGAAVTGASVILALIKGRILLPVVGDAARYLSATPRNVTRRTAIRAAGLKLMEALHKDGAYDRIVLVGHSLGTAIGYDLLRFYWADHVKEIQSDDHDAFKASCELIEDKAAALHAAPDDRAAFLAFRKAQWGFWETIRKIKDKEKKPVWLISDFVTLGSPLAHSDVLLTADRKDPEAALEKQKKARELPTAPPHLEKEGDRECFSYNTGDKFYLHHAAQFSGTRWTNIYFPVKLVFWGDVIGGPVRSQLGPGIRDVVVKTKRNGGLFSHTHYWDLYEADRAANQEAPNYISALWRAVNLLGEDEDKTWQKHADVHTVNAQEFDNRPEYNSPPG